MPDIVILTCGDRIQAEYVESLIASINYLHEQEVSYRWGNSQGSLVGWIRNVAWQQVRKIACKKVIWIDSDISWSQEAFERLISSDKAIISGLYLNEKGDPVGEPLDSRAKYLLHDITEMNWVGLGFLCITKDVIDALPEPFIREGHYGEDVAFCLNARDAGFDLWLDPRIRVSHHKTVAITP